MVDATIVVVIVLGSIVVLIAVSALVALRNRNNSLASQPRLDWLWPLWAVTGASIVFVSLMVYSAYARFLYLLFFAPIIFLTCLVVLLVAAIRKEPRHCLSMLLTLVAFLGASWGLLKSERVVRPSIRWLVWSNRLKAQALAEPTPANGELRHMVWEATGFGGVANETIYLVFDPTDSLATAAKSHSPGKYIGIPCEVFAVLRLESHWYSVQFYTDEAWGQRNTLNCE